MARSGYLRVLGPFPTNLSDVIKANIAPLLEKFKVDIERWTLLHLSLWAKANIFKIYVVPKFNYILQSLPVSVLVFSVAFVWNGKWNTAKILLLCRYAFATWHGGLSLQMWFSVEAHSRSGHQFMIVSRGLSVTNSPFALFYVHPERHSPLSVLNWSRPSITGWHNLLASVAAWTGILLSAGQDRRVLS